MKRILYFTIKTDNGYGISARSILEVFFKLKDVEVDVVYLNDPAFRNQKLKDEYDIAIHHTAPNNLMQDYQNNGYLKMAMSRAKKKYQYVLWETDRLPSGIVEFFKSDNLDGFICPSHFTEGLVKDFGKEIHYIPITQDDISYHPDKRPKNSSTFNVVTVAQLSVRKAIDVSVCAFVNAFKDIPNKAKYYIKIGEKLDNMDVGNLIKANIGRSLLPNPGNIYVIDRLLSQAELESLYLNSHCYLHLSRGEGFGMTPLTAINYGLPVVYSDWSAHTEFLYHDKKSVAVDGRLDFAHSMDTRFGFEPGMKWFECNVSDAADKLRSVYDKWASGKLKFNAPEIVNDYKEEAIIGNITKLIGIEKVEFKNINKIDGINMVEV